MTAPRLRLASILIVARRPEHDALLPRLNEYWQNFVSCRAIPQLPDKAPRCRDQRKTAQSSRRSPEEEHD